MTYKAIDVFHAAEKTFQAYGNESYANAIISKNVLDAVVYAMLDRDSEKVFRDNLEAEAHNDKP